LDLDEIFRMKSNVEGDIHLLPVATKVLVPISCPMKSRYCNGQNVFHVINERFSLENGKDP
jgi:hypothetical protein